MMDNGMMTKLKGLECTSIMMELGTRECGSTICSMEKAKSSIQMVLSIMDRIRMEISMALESLIGVITRHMRENSKTIIFMEKESIDGQIKGNIQAIGIVTRCTVKACLFGMMAGNTKDSM